MKKTTTLLACALGLLSAAGTAQAQKKTTLDSQPEIRHKVEMRKNRLEITPQLVVSINQDFRHFIGGGAVIQYHMTDWLGLGLQVAGGGGLDTGLTNNINGQLPSEASGMSPAPFQPTQEQFHAHLASTQLLMSLFATVTPFAGKLALFGAGFLRYDLYAIAGIGAMRLTNTWDSYPDANKTAAAQCSTSDQDASININTCDPQNAGFKISGTFGAGLHLYFNEWLGLNVELRDYLNSINPGGLDTNGDHKIDSSDQTVQNNLFVGVGLTFMLPLTAKISQ